MGVTILIAACLAVFITLAAFNYSRIKAKLSHSSQAISNYQSQIQQLEKNEHALREQNHDLQVQLDQSVVDSVTNLLSWHLFEDRLNQALKESVRYQFTLAVMFLDLDEFKVINSALGYEVGDTLLREVANRLQSCIRQVDSLSRFSKDTFAVMLPQLGKPETAAIVAQRMLQAITKPFLIGSHELYMNISIGIAIFPTDASDLTSLLRAAEHALHVAKKQGKQTYQFYQEKMTVNSKRELAFSTGLRKESFNQELVSYYQPIVDANTQQIFCMEAQLHWQHPELGLVDPAELEFYAARQGRLNLLTEWLLTTSCRQFIYWQSVGFTPHMLSISLDLKQLENTNFIYKISQLLQEIKIDPKKLILNIKANNSRPTAEMMEKAFNMLNYLGVNLCMDQFGSGLFTLSDLKNYSIQYMKLDPSLTTDIESNIRALDLLKSILKMAQDLKIEVIAGSIQSAEQATFLKSLGCHLLQGKYIAEPVVEKEIPSGINVVTI